MLDCQGGGPEVGGGGGVCHECCQLFLVDKVCVCVHFFVSLCVEEKKCSDFTDHTFPHKMGLCPLLL